MEVSEWVGTLRDVQSSDGQPLEESNFRRRYIGLGGGISVRRSKHHREWIVFEGIDKDGWSVGFRTSAGNIVIDQENKSLTLTTKNSRYIFELEGLLDTYSAD